MALKKSSDVLTISGSVTESAANTFTQQQFSLPLDPLNNEVFVVLAIDIDVSTPSNIPATATQVSASLSVTSQTAVVGIDDSKCLAKGLKAIAQGAGTVDGAAFSEVEGNRPTANLNHIAIIATDDFFAQVLGSANLAAKTMRFRMWGYRARADAATYAALVQSELLS